MTECNPVRTLTEAKLPLSYNYYYNLRGTRVKYAENSMVFDLLGMIKKKTQKKRGLLRSMLRGSNESAKPEASALLVPLPPSRWNCIIPYKSFVGFSM